nr:MAG TPA_asm: hypothetical protein [Bacteriophage sp.]
MLRNQLRVYKQVLLTSVLINRQLKVLEMVL